MIKKIVSVLVVSFMFSLAAKAQQPNRFVPSVLVEFYTSEGCSSCPQADAFATQIKAIADSSKLQVYTIDYHVDLWNQSGWVDPFSDSMYTKRQEMMALANNQRAMFTPMVFVNGKGALPAGAKNEVGKLIENFTRKPSEHYLLMSASWSPESKTLLFNYEIKGSTDSLEVFFVLAQREATSVPNAGENKDIKLSHHNVVRKIASSNKVTANGTVPMLFPVPNVDFDKYAVIGFIQHQRSKQILASQVLEFNQRQETK
jgi:hypothetical protein